MNETQIEKYQGGNKGFEVVGGKCDDCLGYGGYNLHDGFEGRKVCPTCSGDGVVKPPMVGSGEFEKAIQWQFDSVANIGRGITPDDVTDTFEDIRTSHNADMQSLRDQLKQSTKLIEMQEGRIAELKSQVADIADIAKELSTELDVFAHSMGDDLSLMRLTQTADIVIAKVKDEPIPDFGIETVYACEECNDGYVQAGRCCNECGVVFVLPGREI